MSNKNAVQTAYEYLSSKKLEGFEIFYREDERLYADSKGGKVESLEKAKEAGLAIRILNEKRQGFSYTTSFEESHIFSAVDSAIAAGKEVEPDDAHEFVKSDNFPALEWKYCDLDFLTRPVSQKIDVALEVESAAMKSDPRIKRVRRSSYEESKEKLRLVNSAGTDISFEKTIYNCEVMAVAEENGESQWAMDFDFYHLFDSINPSKVGSSAAGMALDLLGAQSISTMKAAVCLHPFVTAQFLHALGKSFQGDNIYKGKSTLHGQMGKMIFAGCVNIIDDGLLKNGYGSYLFDGEGFPQKRTFLVEGGTVSGWLVDSYWGKKMKMPSSSSAARSSVKELPSIGTKNIYLEPGKKTREMLFKKMGKGFYVSNIVGAHMINPITGDFSVGAEGQWIENGEPKFPVKGVVIAGNIKDIFKNTVEAADDLRFMGNTGAPSILISELQIGGQ